MCDKIRIYLPQVNYNIDSTDSNADVGPCPQGHPEDNQGQGDQDQGALNGQIQTLFSFTSSRVYIVLGNQFGDDPMVMIGRVLLCWTP